MAADVQSILEMALEKGRNVLYEGKVASYIPELAKPIRPILASAS